MEILGVWISVSIVKLVTHKRGRRLKLKKVKKKCFVDFFCIYLAE